MDGVGAQGLAEDVRYYGRWMRDEAEKRIGHLYPKVKLPKEYGGRRGDRHRVVVGSQGQMPEPGMRWSDTFGALISALWQGE